MDAMPYDYQAARHAKGCLLIESEKCLGKRRKSSCLRERPIRSSGLGVIGKATSLLTRRTVKANAPREEAIADI